MSLSPDAARIRSLRAELGISGSELAELAELDDRSIRNAEAGHNMNAASLARIAGALDVPLRDIIAISPDALRRRLVRYYLAPPPVPEPWATRPGLERRVHEALARRDPVVCTLVGGQGSGLSSLCAWAADRAWSRCPGGVIWVGAARGDRERDVVEVQLAVADALQFRSRLPAIDHCAPSGFDRVFADELWSSKRLLILDGLLSAEFARRMGALHANARVFANTSLRSVANQLPGEHLELGGLTLDETRAVMSGLLGEPRVSGADGDVAELHRVLGGQPQRVVVAARYLLDRPLMTVSELAASVGRDLATAVAATEPDSCASGVIDHHAGLAAGFACVRRFVTPEAWARLPALAAVGPRSFSLEWAGAAAGTDPTTTRQWLGEFYNAHFVQRLDAPDDTSERGAAIGYRLDAMQALFARRAADPVAVSASRDRLLAHLRRRAEVAHKTDRWDELTREYPLWGEILLEVADEAIGQASAVLASDPSEFQRLAGATPSRLAAFVDAVASVAPVAGLRSFPEAGTWLRAGLIESLRSGQWDRAVELALAMGRWLVSTRVDFPAGVTWFDAATDWGRQRGFLRLAALAASESGRALFSLNRPAEGAARMGVSHELAVEGGAEGIELAVRLNSAAVTYSREVRPGPGWRRANQLLRDAFEHSLGTTSDARLVRAVVASNLAVSSMVLRLEEARTDAEEASRQIRSLPHRSLQLDARWTLLLAVLSGAPTEQSIADCTADWHRAVAQADEDQLASLMWSVGEAAYYTRLVLEHSAGRCELSPVVGAGYGIMDVAREVRLQDRNLVPIGLLFPIHPLISAHTRSYIQDMAVVSKQVLGSPNRVATELEHVASLLASLPARGARDELDISSFPELSVSFPRMRLPRD